MTDQRTRRIYRRELRRRQREIVRAPRGAKLRKWAELRAWQTANLEQAVKARETA